jgi:hypothetical protein
MDSQRFAIKGRVIGADDAQLQDALATSRHARAAALPVRAGRRGDVRGAARQFVVKRMPDSGSTIRAALLRAGGPAVRTGRTGR